MYSVDAVIGTSCQGAVCSQLRSRFRYQFRPPANPLAVNWSTNVARSLSVSQSGKTYGSRSRSRKSSEGSGLRTLLEVILVKALAESLLAHRHRRNRTPQDRRDGNADEPAHDIGPQQGGVGRHHRSPVVADNSHLLLPQFAD